MSSTGSDYDVAIVGAGIAGCTAAALYGRRGVRVALLERRPDPRSWKRVCTHFIQSSALPTMERLGIDHAVYAAGGVATATDAWTRWGWIRPPDPAPVDPQHAVNIRRQVLDPLLREMAAETAGVELILGHTVDCVFSEEGRIAGVEAVTSRGTRLRVTARLVVAADGRGSRVGALAGVPVKATPNGRSSFWAYFRDLPLGTGSRARVWFLEPHLVYAFPTDGGLTLVACFVAGQRRLDFKRDGERAFVEMVRSVPDAPPIDRAERVSKLLGKVDTPNLSRPATFGGGAFIGDAALACDPLWGVGCGFAFQSAEWLVDATVGTLAGDKDLDRSLLRYRRAHRRRLRGHDFLMRDFSTGRPLNAVERLVFSAAARDERMARHLEAFGSRNIGPSRFLSPCALARAGAVNARYRLSARYRSK